ncbi:MAG: pimeloyl-[acyl-carrier protein] methyl ester esterase [Proteobacteria bacterium]|nr:MAG: pimeloyl-[acyl-carrier protein] methyl ester esterase [Pseudomonadota bacterium]QKK11134.1 MAG: pimeloyl-ACP methyl ester esterase BioH [Pseudomonadota bacterium]
MLAEPALYTRTHGAGPELVLVHGWGLNGAVWDELAADLTRRFRVTVLDLPGYGRSPLDGAPYILSWLASELARAVPRPATWLGWSLGGLICQQVAIDFPQRVERLIMASSTPRFVRSAGWPSGIAPEVLTQFAGDLAADLRGTLHRFLALASRGSDHARGELRALRERLLRHGEPAPRAVQGGLALLRDTDLRAELARIRCPALWVLGERDQLVPASVQEGLSPLMPKGCCAVIGGAAHAPFLSHRTEFASLIEEFVCS